MDSKPTSMLSIFTDDGLDMTMGVNESLFVGPDIDPDCSAIVNGKTYASVMLLTIIMII